MGCGGPGRPRFLSEICCFLYFQGPVPTPEKPLSLTNQPSSEDMWLSSDQSEYHSPLGMWLKPANQEQWVSILVFFFFCWNHLEFLGFYWIGWRPQGSRSLLPPRERGSYLKTTSIERKSTDERREEMESWEHFLIPPSLMPAALLNFLPSFPG